MRWFAKAKSPVQVQFLARDPFDLAGLGLAAMLEARRYSAEHVPNRERAHYPPLALQVRCPEADAEHWFDVGDPFALDAGASFTEDALKLQESAKRLFDTATEIVRGGCGG
jgi:hypothetical protein